MTILSLPVSTQGILPRQETMGTTNVQIFNPNKVNQETDAQYTADSLRSGGIATDDIFVSLLGNKVFNQLSTYLWGLFTAFANKGFSTSDASASSLAAQCANFLTTADLKGLGQNVPYNATLVFNTALYNAFACTLTGNITSLTIQGLTTFQVVTIAFTQSGSGGFTVAWPSNVKSPGTIASAAGANSLQMFMCLPDGNLHPIAPMVVS